MHRRSGTKKKNGKRGSGPQPRELVKVLDNHKDIDSKPTATEEEQINPTVEEEKKSIAQEEEEDEEVEYVDSKELNYEEEEEDENEEEYDEQYDPLQLISSQGNQLLEQILSQMNLLTNKINELQEEVTEAKVENKQMIKKEIDKIKQAERLKKTPVLTSLFTPLKKKSVSSSSSSESSSESEDPDSSELYMGANLRNEVKKKQFSPKKKTYQEDDLTYKHLSLGGFKEKKRVVTVATEKHLEIGWKTLSLDGFLCFLEEIEKFQYKYEKEVIYLFPLIHESLQELVAQQLMVNYGSIYIRKRDVQRAPIEHITQAMQTYFIPNDITHFNAMLKSACYPYRVEQKV